MILMGLNHIDLCIPLYAALYHGIMVAGTDPTLGVKELKDTFNITKPKIIFSQSEKAESIENALKLTGLEAKIVAFNKGSDHTTLAEFLKDVDDAAVQDFQTKDYFVFKMPYETGYDAVQLYMSDVTSRVVAKSGIPFDRYHLGKIILHSLQDDPDFVMQIDGATNELETNGSALNRTVRCAIAFKALGLQKGDVMILMGLNHIDLCIPLYAALYLGIMVAGTDPTLGVKELKDTFNITKPKIIFSQSEKAEAIEKALGLAGLESKIVAFNKGSDHTTLAEFLKDVDDAAVQDFQPADFNPDETPAFLASTSGTTGLPKAAILTHKNLSISIPYLWIPCSKFPTPTRMAVIMSPIQWLTASFQHLFGPILKFTRLQTSAALTPEHFAYLLNTYKPTNTIVSPLLMNSMFSASDKCDFTCFEYILLGGSAVSQEILDKLKELTKAKHIYAIYGMSEIGGAAFHHEYPPPKGSSGTPRGGLGYRLVDRLTKQDITEANIPGELWLRGPQVFKGYYNNPELTAETLTEDGWMKTGDIFYRDDHWHFYFVERMKLLLKYRNHQVSPTEVEAVIRQHPDVFNVCVTGIPDKECGDLVTACVIAKPGTTPRAQEIKDIVKETLTDSKQLRGGVIFLKEFPTTGSGKIHMKKLQEMILTMERE